MPLSRHFYALDEVETVLAYSTTRHDPKETLFWSRELIQSGCPAEAIRALFEAWLWEKGPFHISWALYAWERLAGDEVVEEDILQCACQLQYKFLLRDHSLWNILMMSRFTTEQPDRLSRSTPSWLSKSSDSSVNTDIEHAFLCAIYQKKARLAWWFANKIPIYRVWDLMEQYACNDSRWGDRLVLWRNFCKTEYKCLLGNSNDAYDDVMRCLFLLSLCLTRKQFDNSMTPIQMMLIEPDPMEIFIGRKEYRRYSIPVHILYGITDRGCIPWNTHTRYQLYNIEPHLVGCPFWDDVLTEYATGVNETTGEIQWISYDTKEAFYDRYFPDSPPDEWTEKEIAISHGVGILRPGDVLHLHRYAQIHFSKLTRLAWNIVPQVYRHLCKNNYEQIGYTAFAELPYKEDSNEVSIKIEPVMRRFTVLN